MPNWAQRLQLRDEVVGADGAVGELQMSLGKVVYQTADVPYRDVDYWADITEPTDSLIEVFGRVARRLWSPSSGSAQALYHLAQGMGGGKSHALVGLWHMATSPEGFFATDLGHRVREAAERTGDELDLGDVHVVSLCCDQFSPQKASPLFGPAVTLFERFLWGMFPDDRDAYDELRDRGPNKHTIVDAFKRIDRPVLVLIDEIMDYVQQLSMPELRDAMPDERAFVNSLFDACDDVPEVACLLVMIRSDLDQAGYEADAQEFREYAEQRMKGDFSSRVQVTESKDFLNIIRRRLFEELPDDELLSEAVDAFASSVDATWREQVYDRLPQGRNLTTTIDQLPGCYPFHPDLVRLVQDEWSATVGFQRVRSTVRIFAASLMYWFRRQEKGGWVPSLVGVGDLPLDGVGVLDSILSSGLLMGSSTAVQGFANLAGTDVTSLKGDKGRAVDIDRDLAVQGLEVDQPRPAVRMATALFNLSLVSRQPQAKGATKTELHSAVWSPAMPFTAAEEVFVHLIDPDHGLGSLDKSEPGNGRNRYWLSIKRTLQAQQRTVKNQFDAEDGMREAWDHAKVMAARHQSHFDRVVLLDAPDNDASASELVGEIDAKSTRLVILDPTRWALLNGNDGDTREDVDELLGVGDTTVPHAASCVVSIIYTNQSKHVVEKARDVLAWQHVVEQVEVEDDEDVRRKATQYLKEATAHLRQRLETAFRNYAFVAPGADGRSSQVEYRRFDDDTRTALRGDHVWQELIDEGRATQPGQLGAKTLELLLGQFDRPLTPKEIIQAFYGDPRFPLVASTDDITRAWDGLLGVGPLATGGWALVQGDGTVRNVNASGQVALNRVDVTFKPESEVETGPEETATGDAEPGDIPDQQITGYVERDETETIPEDAPPYREYRLTIPSVSLAEVSARRDVMRILSTLADKLDLHNRHLDPQVIDVRINVTMREHDMHSVREAIERLGKGRLDEDEPLA